MVEIHPELRGLARLLPRSFVGPAFVRLTRMLTRWRGMPRLPQIDGVDVADHRVAVAGAGDVRVRLYRPATTAPVPVLVWFHGGGYVIGSPEQDEASHLALVRRLGIAVAAVGYRLAPEHPHPAALNDAMAALRFVHDSGPLHRLDATRVVVGGQSAGGGLAAAAALQARDEGLALCGQVLIYPMIDDRTIARDDVDARLHRVWSVPSNTFAWRAYVGDGAGGDRVDARAVPARATRLAGLPPTWIGVGSADLFHDEDVAFADRLRAAGVPCTLEVIAGAFHGFDVVAPRTTVARGFRAAWTTALRGFVGVNAD